MTQEVRLQTRAQPFSEVSGVGQQTEGSSGVPHAPDAQVLLGSAEVSLGGGARAPEAHLALNH
eukprot:12213768-Alexandrium_andersonii.AAC.1